MKGADTLVPRLLASVLFFLVVVIVVAIGRSGVVSNESMTITTAEPKARRATCSGRRERSDRQLTVPLLRH